MAKNRKLTNRPPINISTVTIVGRGRLDSIICNVMSFHPASGNVATTTLEMQQLTDDVELGAGGVGDDVIRQGQRPVTGDR